LLPGGFINTLCTDSLNIWLGVTSVWHCRNWTFFRNHHPVDSVVVVMLE
jgi:hypothetical protein